MSALVAKADIKRKPIVVPLTTQLRTLERSGSSKLMKLCDLYNQITAHWPETIELTACANPDGPIWRLVEVYEAIEEKTGIENPWLEVSAWAFHQSLVETARAQIQKGKHFIMPYDVNIDFFDKYLRDNLDDPSWATEREIYLNENPAWPST